jgi:inward rectifier potassium channel
LLLPPQTERRNQILEPQVSVTLVRDERTVEGGWMRRFYDLQLGRRRSPIFAMTFTVMYAIDPTSPLANATASSLATEVVETSNGFSRDSRLHAAGLAGPR